MKSEYKIGNVIDGELAEVLKEVKSKTLVIKLSAVNL